MGTAVATQQQANAQTPAANKAPATIDALIRGDAFRSAIQSSLPTHLRPDRFVRIALTALTRTPKLRECDQSSFFSALLTLSQMGLEPDGRRAHLIPFRNNKRGVVECQLIVDYKGMVELVMRSGKVSNIHADVVCENDVFEYDRGELRTHKIDFRKPRGEVYAAYALVRFKDGTEKCEVMTREDIEHVRGRSRAAHDGPWVTDWNEMAKKTVFRRLTKWLELSPELRDAVEADDHQYADSLHVTPINSQPLPAALTIDDIATPSEVALPAAAQLAPKLESPPKQNGSRQPRGPSCKAEWDAVDKFSQAYGQSVVTEAKREAGYGELALEQCNARQLQEIVGRLTDWEMNASPAAMAQDAAE